MNSMRVKGMVRGAEGGTRATAGDALGRGANGSPALAVVGGTGAAATALGRGANGLPAALGVVDVGGTGRCAGARAEGG
jgi:hypothetical protein